MMSPDKSVLRGRGLGPSVEQKRLIGRGKTVWVAVVAACYCLAFLGMLFVTLYVTVTASEDARQLAFGITVFVVMVTSQIALLLVPVSVLSRRPVRRCSVWFPVVTSGVLFGLLVLGASLALAELFSVRGTGDPGAVLGVALGVASWLAWIVVFYRMSASSDPGEIGFKLHLRLFKGSVLELLIAVPAHLVVRQRHECSAGISTFVGICTGVAVMLIAFGPSVVVLYASRCMGITPSIGKAMSPAQRRRLLLLWGGLSGVVVMLILLILLTGGFFLQRL